MNKHLAKITEAVNIWLCEKGFNTVTKDFKLSVASIVSVKFPMKDKYIKKETAYKSLVWFMDTVLLKNGRY